MAQTRPTIREQLARSADEIGPLDGPAATAELLVAVANDTRDRDVWGGDRAITYWDRLPERVRAACYGGPTVAHWWERMCRTLGCVQPRRAEDRQALAAALAGGSDRQVLDVLRTQTEAICLRVRLAIQITRQSDTTTIEPAVDGQEALLP